MWPRASDNCPATPFVTFTNITLKDVKIINPKQSPGVLIGNEENPIENLVFDNVVVENPGGYPWGDQYYYCKHVNGKAIGKTWPIPPCMTDETDDN